MLTKTFNQAIRAAVTGESFTLKRVDGSVVTVTIPATVSNSYSQYFTQGMLRIPALMKQDRYSSQVSIAGSGGVCFGTGTAEPTEDDYTITQKVMNAGSGMSVTCGVAQNGNTWTGTYTIINSGTADVTISEVGLYGTIMYSSNSYYCYLIDRTLLEEPITIPANGGVGQIVYTVNIP